MTKNPLSLLRLRLNVDNLTTSKQLNKLSLRTPTVLTVFGYLFAGPGVGAAGRPGAAFLYEETLQSASCTED